VSFMDKSRMLRVAVLPAVMVAVTVWVACGGTADTPVPAPTDSIVAPDATRRPTLTLAPRQLQTEPEGNGSEVLGPY
jgi:hypothetical protein